VELRGDPLPAAEDKRDFVRTMFERIAPRYDLMNRLMTFGMDQGWRRRALEAIEITPGDRVVDLATGTGDLAALANACGASVIGIDLANGMLRAAQRRNPQILFVCGDALRLPLDAASVDAITCGFALRNLTNLPAAFREWARVLRPGGRLALLEVDRPRSRWVRLGHSVHFRRIVPALGALLSDREAYRYLPESTRYLPTEHELLSQIESAGFSRVCKQGHLFGAVQRITARRGS